MNKTAHIGCSTPKTNTDTFLSNVTFQKRSLRYFIAVLPFALVLLISTSYQQNPDDLNYLEQDYFVPGMVDSLRTFLVQPSESNEVGGEKILDRAYLRSFYFQNGYKPVWIRFNTLSDRASGLLYMIEHANEYGLEPSNYHIQSIHELQKNLSPEFKTGNESENLKLELLLSDAAFRMMVHLHSGYQVFDSAFYTNTWVVRLPQILIHGIARNRVIECMQSVEPRFPEYQRLRMASELFVRSNVLSDRSLQILYPNKDSVVLYGQIRDALIQAGYLKESNQDLVSALKGFQKFHGLTCDGKPGLNTIKALQASSLYNYKILALNLDRLRKNRKLEANMLYVNIPAYRLKIYESNAVKDTYRVIVGNPKTPTPLLTGNMERIIANPMWYVPKKIAVNEILPKLKSDSTYLSRNGFKVLDKNHNVINAADIDMNNMREQDFNYTFRQNRGTDNSLGQVKFIFSNPYAVYLHDTPGKSLFSKDLRAFSHGCVRVQNPEKLANYILQRFNSDTTDFAALMHTGRHREFTIQSSLPIKITYITCEGDENGHVYFYKDIYERDEKELEFLAQFMGI